MRHNGGRRPEEILAEIERTRTDMDATLSAIEHRLTPGQLVDQGIDYLRHSGANEFIANLGGSVKHNPMPVSLVGIGMRTHAGIASRMFGALAGEGINIQMISTSEIKISVVVDEKYAELAVRVLHKAFELDQE